MTRTSSPSLHLHVQYDRVLRSARLPARDQVQRWIRAALAVYQTHSSGGSVPPTEMTVRFSGTREAREFNRTFRGKDYATNVLTFSMNESALDMVCADVVICVPVVTLEAQQQQKTFHAHCAHMVIHATLHAHGLDHENDTDAEYMEQLEVAALRRFRIANPYL